MNKKQLIVINKHSFVDVITNSSSELFVLDTDKSLDTFKSLLNELIEKYNSKVNSGDFKENGWNARETKIEDFDEPYIYTKEMYDAHVEQDKKYIEEDKKRNAQRIAEGKQPWSHSGGYLWGYENENNIGKIILESSSDNTIPYEMWDMINDTFNGTNFHLG